MEWVTSRVREKRPKKGCLFFAGAFYGKGGSYKIQVCRRDRVLIKTMVIQIVKIAKMATKINDIRSIDTYYCNSDISKAKHAKCIRWCSC